MSDLREEFSAELVEAAKFKVRLAYTLGPAALTNRSGPMMAIYLALVERYPEVLDHPGMKLHRDIATIGREHIAPASIKAAIACLFEADYPWKETTEQWKP